MAEKDERDARLDELKASVEEYGEKKLEQLSSDVEFMKSVIDGRTGAGQLMNQGIVDSSNLLAESIKQFLEG
jgi:hypothetical protein